MVYHVYPNPCQDRTTIFFGFLQPPQAFSVSELWPGRPSLGPSRFAPSAAGSRLLRAVTRSRGTGPRPGPPRLWAPSRGLAQKRLGGFSGFPLFFFCVLCFSCFFVVCFLFPEGAPPPPKKKKAPVHAEGVFGFGGWPKPEKPTSLLGAMSENSCL